MYTGNTRVSVSSNQDCIIYSDSSSSSSTNYSSGSSNISNTGGDNYSSSSNTGTGSSVGIYYKEMEL